MFSCLQIAKAFGASEIIAVDVQDEKLENAKMLGATHTINAKKENAIDKIKVHSFNSSFTCAFHFIFITKENTSWNRQNTFDIYRVNRSG